jgi:hypothetical protein
VRAVVLLVMLGGCQVLFKLEGGDRPPCDNPLGHDEDLDGFDDACDFCPFLPDEVDPDSDGDGVGDACDPTPEVACEARLRFDGFAVPPADLVTTDDWRHDEDDLVQPDPSATTALAHFPITSMFDNVVFRAGITITGVDETDEASFEIGTGGSTIGDEPSMGYACAIHRPAAGPPIDVRLVDEEPDALIGSSNFSGELASTFGFEVVNTPSGFLSCAVAGLQGFGKVTKEGATPRSRGELFLFADDMAARVHWMEVFQYCGP